MTVIAIPEAPPIICPSWCIVTQAEHVADLPHLDGRVIHWSPNGGERAGCCVSIGKTTLLDGTPDGSDHTLVFISDAGYQDGTTPEQAEAFARQILATVAEARR